MNEMQADFLMERLVRSKTWADTKRFIELNPVLLSPQIDPFIAAKLIDLEPENGMHEALIDHQQLLGLCRLQGIDAAFDVLLEADHQALTQRFSQMFFSDDPARKANILQAKEIIHFHFACHGIYYPERPLESELSLTGEDTLTTEDLLDGAASPKRPIWCVCPPAKP